MKTRSRLRNVGVFLMLLTGVTFCWNGFPDQTLSATTLSAGSSHLDLQTMPIESLQVGQRTLGRNARRAEVDLTLPEVNAKTWVKLDLQLIKSNGDLLDITLLRPHEWAESTQATVGGTIDLDLEEMGAQGAARVVAISPCPPIASGEGNVITGKFVHRSSGNLLNVSLEDSDEEIGVTANHPFWSEDRRAYVPIGEMHVGETVRTEHGLRRIGKILPRPRDEPVYNLEVHLEHVYLVGSTGTLVHNNCVPKKVHGNTAGHQPATLYEKYDADGNFLKHGVSQDPSKRYSKAELNGGYLEEKQSGPRRQILDLERDLVERLPGPENRERWAGIRSGE